MRLKNGMIICFSILALGSIMIGGMGVTRSPLFFVRIVEIADHPENAPLDAQMISSLASIPIGKESLFHLDLHQVEHRLLSNPWIQEVKLQKRFPQTIVISVIFREPYALFQKKDGTLAYVDSKGTVFGDFAHSGSIDLPILLGFDSHSNLERIKIALRILEVWGQAYLDQIAKVSSISFKEEAGYSLLVIYGQQRVRTLVELGQDFDTRLGLILGRLHLILKYLAGNVIQARKIWADIDKKIVVKLAHPS